MISPLLLGLALHAPQEPLPGDPFAVPRLFTMSFQEALQPPNRPRSEPMALGPLPRPASQPWLRFALGFLANDAFERWEQDPRAARHTKGQPSGSWTRLAAPRP